MALISLQGTDSTAWLASALASDADAAVHLIVPADKAGAILNLQGVKMGRPSHVHVSIGVEQGDVTSVRVGGEAVLAGEGTLYI